MDEDPSICSHCGVVPHAISSNAPCGHGWCTGCLGEYLDRAIKFESDYPIKICGLEKPLNINMIADKYDALKEPAEKLLAKMEEYDTAIGQRLYTRCCVAFISTENRRACSAKCKVCQKDVCVRCGRPYHEETACTSDLDDETKAYIEEKTRKCPKCTIPIEKDEGCNHMSCIKCNYQFCWVCLAEYLDNQAPGCNCERYEGDDGVEGAEDEVEGDGADSTLEMRLNDHRFDCPTGDALVRQDGDVCELCGYTYDFVMRCEWCDMRFCLDCRQINDV